MRYKTKKPFWPWTLDSPFLYPVCGVGPESQYMLDMLKLMVFAPIPRGIPRHPELVSLSEKINKVFKKEASSILAKEKKKSGIKDLQITVADIDNKRLCLSFAVPYEKLDKKTQRALLEHIKKKSRTKSLTKISKKL